MSIQRINCNVFHADLEIVIAPKEFPWNYSVIGNFFLERWPVKVWEAEAGSQILSKSQEMMTKVKSQIPFLDTHTNNHNPEFHKIRFFPVIDVTHDTHVNLLFIFLCSLGTNNISEILI